MAGMGMYGLGIPKLELPWSMDTSRWWLSAQGAWDGEWIEGNVDGVSEDGVVSNNLNRHCDRMCL
jgi:hypothetical protein